MTVRAVFFDSGHTLMRPIDGRWFPGPRFFEICAAHGLTIADDDRLRAACDAGYAFLDEHHDQVPDVDAERHQFAIYYGVVLDHLGTARPADRLTAELATALVDEPTFEPYPTTRWVLDELAGRRIPMAIITDAWPSVRTKYERLGLLEHFASFVISAEERCTKPDVRMFRPALDAIGVEPGEVLFVDDDTEIIAGALQLGFRAHRIDLEGSPAPLTSHADVLGLVDSLAS